MTTRYAVYAPGSIYVICSHDGGRVWGTTCQLSGPNVTIETAHKVVDSLNAAEEEKEAAEFREQIPDRFDEGEAPH